jgi:predicted DNA repair protein MutK
MGAGLMALYDDLAELTRMASLAISPMWMNVVVLAIVGLGMPFLGYGVVVLIVKADDFSVYLAGSGSGGLRPFGRWMVAGKAMRQNTAADPEHGNHTNKIHPF